MRNSNFNLIKSLGYIVVLVSMASHSVPHEYWQNTEDGLLYGHVGDSEEEHKLLMMEGAVWNIVSKEFSQQVMFPKSLETTPMKRKLIETQSY